MKMNRGKETSHPIIHWFRNDLRLSDNPALAEAAKSAQSIVPVYILEDKDSDLWVPGGASRWWLHHSLAALNKSLEARGNRLILRRGQPKDVLQNIVTETGATAVHVTRSTEPHAIKTESEAKNILNTLGVRLEEFSHHLLYYWPKFPEEPFRPEFKRFAWVRDEEALRRW